MVAPKWQRIVADRHPGCATCGVETVYWSLDTGATRLTVSPPRYSDGLGWRWRRYGPSDRPADRGRRETIVAEGFEATVGAAKAAAA